MPRSLRLALLGVLFLSPAFAQVQKSAQKQPVEIEASQQMEWLRNENKYRATGDVVITQGSKTIHGDNAEALYDPKQGPSALTQITMTGHVVMNEAERKVTGDQAVYDTRSQELHVTGNPVTVTGKDLTVTAHDSVDYNAQENKAVAIGKAEVKQPGQTLRAQRITAWFDQNDQLQRAQAQGGVIIIRQTGEGQDIAEADRGDYDITKDKAVLTGNVKLTRGQNHMQGDVATIDLKTGDSNLQSAQNTGQNNGKTGRVRAVFTPGDNTPDLANNVPMVKAKRNFEPAQQTSTQ